MRVEDAAAVGHRNSVKSIPLTPRASDPGQIPSEPVWADQQHRRSLAVSERRLLLITVDLIVLLALGYTLSGELPGPGNFVGLGVLLAVPWLVYAQIAGLYDLSTAAREKATLRSLTTTSTLFGVTLLLAFFLTSSNGVNGAPHFLLSHGKVLSLFIAGPVAIGLWRLVYIRLFGAAHFQRRVLVLGAGSTAATLIRAVNGNDGHGVAVLGLIDDDPSKAGQVIEGVKVVGDSSLMWPLVSSMGVEEVILTINQPKNQALYQGLGICYEHSIAVSLMPRLYEEVTGQVPVEHMGPTWFGSVQLGRSGGGIFFAAKRLLDVLLGSAAVVLTFPIVLVVALLVKTSSRGPILHRQERVGLHGKAFKIIKFRTMSRDAEKPGEALWADLDDPRATKVGRWLRRTHLDELPQFYLVVKGDMSLVGPRPERPEFVRQLEATIPLYRARYSMRPGIAGWAQVNYPYGASVEDALAKLRFDLYYVKNWSPLLDTAILVRTITRVFGLRGR